MFPRAFQQKLGAKYGLPGARNAHDHGSGPVEKTAADQIVQSLNPDDRALGGRCWLRKVPADWGLNAADHAQAFPSLNAQSVVARHILLPSAFDDFDDAVDATPVPDAV